ncbi:carboxypeptidase-like regulatory domain-containing protein [bacterium]|nr:carboxypeptidase-like regulatory domain-containing protein [bacterium]
MHYPTEQNQKNTNLFFKNLFIFIIVMGVHSIQLSGQTNLYKITGHVQTLDKREPLHMVNIFLANTSLGTTTHKDGKFTLERIPPGRYTLIVSMMGYKLHKENIVVSPEGKSNYNFILAQKTLMGQTVTVTADKLPNWDKDLEYFKELFLGISDIAQKCEILNPEVLCLKRNSDGDFSATATYPINIKNHTLGYKITYHLDHLIYTTSGNLSFTGDAQYESMHAENSGQSNKWEKARDKVYRGSLQHFYSSMAAKRSMAEGFRVTRYSSWPQPGVKPTITDLDPDQLCLPASQYYEALLHLPRYIQITYIRTNESEWYYKAIKQSPSWYLTSMLEVHSSPLIVNRCGRPISPLTATSYGYWAYLSLADKLPLNYTPIRTNPVRDDIIWKNLTISITSNIETSSPVTLIKLASRQAVADSLYTATANLYAGLERLGNHTYADTLMKTMWDILSDSEKKIFEKSDNKGRNLLQAWQQRDPSPATPENERFIEHMQRFDYAKKYFRSKHQSRGYDDRGMIWIRYGKPYDRVRAINPRICHPNESWLYTRYNSPVLFDFIKYPANYTLRGPVWPSILPASLVSDTTYVLEAKKEWCDLRTSFHPEYLKENGLIYTPLNEQQEFLPQIKSWLAHNHTIEGKIQYARFIKNNMTCLEFYYALPFSQLALKDDSLANTIDLRLSYKVYDDTMAVFEQADKIGKLPFKQDYINKELDYQGQLNLKIPPGAAQCAFSMSSLNNGGVFRQAFQTEGYDATLSDLFLSDIQIASKVEPAPPKYHVSLEPFIKNGLLIKPYAYNEIDPNNILYLYYEAYNLTLNEQGGSHYETSYTLKTNEGFFSRINPFKRRRASVSSSIVQSGGDRMESIYFAIDFGSLKSGNYYVETCVKDLLSGKEARSIRSLCILK